MKDLFSGWKIIILSGILATSFMSTLKELAAKSSIERKGSPLTHQEVGQYMRSLPGWNLIDGSIEKEFRFTSYLDGLAFANEIGKIAEEQDHHPDILIKWRRVKLTLSTHSVKGLSENDFIVAAKSELKYRESRLG
jgi:4a-hydroxytetrahydrobiopterin dehydratase